MNENVVKLGNILNNGQLSHPDKPIELVEIKHVIFSMRGNKAPGPDDFTTGFYQYHSDIVKHDLYQAVLYCITMNKIPQTMAATVIHLFPKTKHSATTTDQ